MNDDDEALLKWLDHQHALWGAAQPAKLFLQAATRIRELRARVAELEAALRPFASIKANDGDDFSGMPDEVIIRCEVTAGDLRKARESRRPGSWEGEGVTDDKLTPDEKRMNLLFSTKGLRRKIATDPDDEPTAGDSPCGHTDWRPSGNVESRCHGCGRTAAEIEVEGLKQLYGVAGHHLKEMLHVYRRRVLSDCHSQAEIDRKPWECAEYRGAAEFLRRYWPYALEDAP